MFYELLFPFFVSLSALFFSYFLALKIRKNDETAKVKEISSHIRKGALIFLKKEYRVIIFFLILIFFALLLLVDLGGYKIAISFICGAALSGLAGNLGMRIATLANGKTACASKTGIKKPFKIAFSSGAVMGLSVVSLNLLGISVLYFFFKDLGAIYGFSFGASLMALFARVGGGIFTKAADVGADLAGKFEIGIPEDDPRNPAVIADNVGDNVGDVAGMGADLFESYAGAIIASMILGSVFLKLGSTNAVIFPMLLAALGILASIFGSFIIFYLIRLLKQEEQKEAVLQKIMNIGIWSAAFFVIVFSFFAVGKFFENMGVFYSILVGIIAGIIIGLITEYYTSYRYGPTKYISKNSKSGAGTNIISGLALGFQSVAVPVVTVSVAILIAHHLAGFYGVAIATVGMLSTLGITLAADTYGPVADNAAGIAEMAGLGPEARERTERLDSIGNTTAAVGKGFAVGSAALTAVVLTASYVQISEISLINLALPEVLVGVFFGGLLPFVFSSFSLNAVSGAAFDIVSEVRRQWREIPGLIEGRAKADYVKCIEISTDSALKKMVLPALTAVGAPILVGFLLGKEALGGFLIGSIVVGFMLAIFMANSGGSWDNAKKYIESGNFGGKGSQAHKASIIGDTVGDPLKDTAGPSLNILIKLMSIIALIIAPLI